MFDFIKDLVRKAQNDGGSAIVAIITLVGTIVVGVLVIVALVLLIKRQMKASMICLGIALVAGIVAGGGYTFLSTLSEKGEADINSYNLAPILALGTAYATYLSTKVKTKKTNDMIQ
ncbi:hypothetical protein AALK46_13005 [Staphylococcus nepalensis]|uniref:hypothetical protein n=1 Tax=Staphylococcus nepalensis TaxID=214473 RepID=UPI0035124FD9